MRIAPRVRFVVITELDPGPPIVAPPHPWVPACAGTTVWGGSGISGLDSSTSLRITVALRRPRKTMKMRPSFHRRSGAGRSPGAGARFPTQGRTDGIGPWQFVFIAMTFAWVEGLVGHLPTQSNMAPPRPSRLPHKLAHSRDICNIQKTVGRCISDRG